jgi:hypothetical protein
MKLEQFPFCCTASIVYDFGGTQVSEHIHNKSKGAIETYLRSVLKYKEGHLYLAITNSQQKAANSVLKKLGFKHSKWMSKRAHPETKIRLWWRQAKPE